MGAKKSTALFHGYSLQIIFLCLYNIMITFLTIILRGNFWILKESDIFTRYLISSNSVRPMSYHKFSFLIYQWQTLIPTARACAAYANI